jgi:hypothetical protein
MEVELKIKTVTVLDRKTIAERELVSFEIVSLDGNVGIKVKDALVSEVLTTANDKCTLGIFLLDRCPDAQVDTSTLLACLLTSFIYHMLATLRGEDVVF